MNILSQFHKKKVAWILLGISVLFILLRLPSLIEPYWYGDEAIYQVIAHALNNGNLLYRDIWDNKPPLLYLLYAAANSDQIVIRTISLVVGLLTTLTFFVLSLSLFRSLKIAGITAGIFAFIFGSPIIEGNIANAENFMLLPICFAAFLIYHTTQQDHVTKRKFSFFHLATYRTQHCLLLAGLLLGIAFLFKTVAMFDFAAFFLFLILTFFSSRKKLQIRKQELQSFVRHAPLYVGAFLLPLVLAVIYFSTQGALSDFIQAAFFGNVDYVGVENSLWGISQGLLYLKLFCLLVALLLLYLYYKKLSLPALFILLWLTFSFFSTTFSGRPYTHYLLMSLPAFCLVVGLFLYAPKKLFKVVLAGILVTIIFIASQFSIRLDKFFAYYPTTVQYITGSKDSMSYQSFFDPTTPRDYAVASFLKANVTKEDTIFMWGDHPQIYILADKIPPYKYTVAYHVIPTKELLDETAGMIATKKPNYIIVLDEAKPLPFSLPTYIIRYELEGATIYERTF